MKFERGRWLEISYVFFFSVRVAQLHQTNIKKYKSHGSSRSFLGSGTRARTSGFSHGVFGFLPDVETGQHSEFKKHRESSYEFYKNGSQMVRILHQILLNNEPVHSFVAYPNWSCWQILAQPWFQEISPRTKDEGGRRGPPKMAVDIG